jgi:hypothetical protein
MVTHRDWEDAFNKELKCPKSLEGNCAPWVENGKEAGVLYQDGKVKDLNGVGKKTRVLEEVVTGASVLASRDGS